MKTKYYAVSINPNFYDVEAIGKMSLKEAVMFFELGEHNEEAFTIMKGKIEDCNMLKPEGDNNDIDTLFVWFY